MGVTVRLLGLLLITTAPASARELADDWIETGLGPADLARVVDDEPCRASAESFVGCVAAIDSLLSADKTPSRLVLDGNSVRIAPLAVVSVEPEQADAVAEIDSLNARARVENLAWRAYLAAGGAAGVSFGQLAADSLQNLRQPARQAPALADALNAYYAVARDPHTSIVPRAFRDRTQPESYSGIGVDLMTVQGRFVVLHVKDGSPAQAAGLQMSDVIDSVDGVPIANATVDEAIARLRGPAGSVVRVDARRRASPLRLAIERHAITEPNVTARALTDFTGRAAGYVRLRSFEDAEACASARTALSALLGRGDLGALVLDLRDNLGGHIDQAACVAAAFVGPGKDVAYLYAKELVTQFMGMQSWLRYSDYTYIPQYTTDEAMTDLPLTVLVNGSSASASELVAGALQDFGRAFVVGTRTFGKGTFQQPYDFPGNEAVVLMQTGGRFYLPSKRSNQLVGIEPDFAVPALARQEERVFREADLYLNPLPAEGAPWVQPRPGEIARLDECAAGDAALTEAVRHEEASGSRPTDQQLLRAERLALCSAEYGPRQR